LENQKRTAIELLKIGISFQKKKQECFENAKKGLQKRLDFANGYPRDPVSSQEKKNADS
jgi:hypothetical protein